MEGTELKGKNSVLQQRTFSTADWGSQAVRGKHLDQDIQMPRLSRDATSFVKYSDGWKTNFLVTKFLVTGCGFAAFLWLQGSSVCEGKPMLSAAVANQH
jgi:hypothetical protein